MGQGPEQFLKYIYTAHRPINTRHALRQDANSNLKKAYKEAIVHYHPDKVSVEQHGGHIKDLYEEITKFLTERYQYFRDVDGQT